MNLSAGRVIYGEGTIHRLPDLVISHGFQRVMLVTGRGSFHASGAADVLSELESAASVARWNDFSTNIDVSDLIKGLRILDSCNPDCVIGIGGGSTMDMAKLLSIFAGNSNDGTIATAIRSGTAIPPRGIGLLLTPTTSGSGSEATHFAVAYIENTKFSVAHPSLRPDIAIVDPTLTASSSAYQRASSGLDAVCHAIESMWAVGATAASRRLAHRALKCLLAHIEEFVERPGPANASAMAIGSHLAGRAIDVSKTTAAHALSYAITRRFGIGHGHAAAMTLGAFIELHSAEGTQVHPSLDAPTLSESTEAVVRALGGSNGTDARLRFYQLMERLGLDARLSRLGSIDDATLVELVEAVNVERLGNNPVMCSEDALLRIVTSVA